MKHAKIFVATMAVALTCGTAALQAQSASPTDRAFVAKVSQGGLYEVEAGRVAAMRGHVPAVKDFGAMDEHDHVGVNSALKHIASMTGVEIKPGLNAEFTQRLDKLKAVPADQFDAYYLNDMKQIHNNDEGLFLKESENGSQAYKTFAHQTATLVKAHLGWQTLFSARPIVFSCKAQRSIRVSSLDSMLERNKNFAAQQTTAGTLMPSLPAALPDVKAIIIGCADMRVDPSPIFGLKPGEAVVLRNIGGRITPSLLEQLGLLGRIGEVAGEEPWRRRGISVDRTSPHRLRHDPPRRRPCAAHALLSNTTRRAQHKGSHRSPSVSSRRRSRAPCSPRIARPVAYLRPRL